MSHAIVTTVDGQRKYIRSRYRSDCPACDKPIEIGHAITPYRVGRRKRWKHEDCDNVPATPTALGNGELTARARELAKKAAQEALELIVKLEARVEELEGREPKRVEITLTRADGERVKIEGHVHAVFEEVCKLAAARKHIFLPGPSGCGKSHLAQQIAEALGLRFGSISCSAGMSESQLLGRMVPHGDAGQFEFLTTEFLDCYENGGVFLFDELDAADANVLLVINSALANGRMSVPARHGSPTARRHPDFVCLGAANTYGRGADRQYVGRNELDEATLDRFRIGTVPMDYDEALERQLCPDERLYERLTGYRRKVAENRLERIVSTRFIRDAYEMVAVHGWSDEQVDAKLFAGWRRDEIVKVRGD